MGEKHQYHLRPGYGSKELLFEFFPGAENEAFLPDLFNSLKEINPTISDVTDLWMNDEILMNIGSDSGNFQISKDIWGYVFILAENNQTCLQGIDDILQKDERFEKVEVDFEKYKLDS